MFADFGGPDWFRLIGRTGRNFYPSNTMSHWPKPPAGIAVLKYGTPGYTEISERFKPRESFDGEGRVSLVGFILSIIRDRQFRADEIAILKDREDKWRCVARKGSPMTGKDMALERVKNPKGYRCRTKQTEQRDRGRGAA